MARMRTLTVLSGFPLAVASAAGSAAKTALDLAPYVNPGLREMKAWIDGNIVSGSLTTVDVKIQESSASGTGFADITGASFAQITSNSVGVGVTGSGLQEIHFRTALRYARFVVTCGGCTPSATISGGIVVEKRNPTS